MKRTLYAKLPKESIGNLPLVAFGGKIIVVMTPGETDKAVNFLLTQDILGIDTETRPSFKKGESHRVALLQVATRDVCFLFRLNMTGITPAIKHLLENETVPMVGLSLHDDLHMLHQREDFKKGWFIDLQDLVGELGIQDLSLQKLYANFFKEKISKRQQLSNWEADVLSDKQKRYAATDAWACIRLFEEICLLKKTGNYLLIDNESPANQH